MYVLGTISFPRLANRKWVFSHLRVEKFSHNLVARRRFPMRHLSCIKVWEANECWDEVDFEL